MLIKMTYQLRGLSIENYMGEVLEGHNCNFVTTLQELQKYHFYFQNPNSHECFVLKLWEDLSRECTSSWTTAAYGESSFKKIENFPENFDYVPQNESLLDLEQFRSTDEDDLNVSNDYFDFSSYGGDPYYPSGYVEVKFEKLLKVN